MACVSDDSYTPLPSTVSRCLPLGGQELQNITDEPNSYDFLYSAYRLERGFPVYAMDIPNPDYDSVLASYVDHSGGADLIWDAVKQEAKLEDFPCIPSGGNEGDKKKKKNRCVTSQRSMESPA